MDYIKNDKAFVLRIAKQKLSRYYSLVERLRIFIPMTVTNEDGDEVELSGIGCFFNRRLYNQSNHAR